MMGLLSQTKSHRVLATQALRAKVRVASLRSSAREHASLVEMGGAQSIHKALVSSLFRHTVGVNGSRSRCVSCHAPVLYRASFYNWLEMVRTQFCLTAGRLSLLIYIIIWVFEVYPLPAK